MEESSIAREATSRVPAKHRKKDALTQEATAEKHGEASLERLYPQLKARRNVSREQVAAHQRTRLHAAMIEACARKGYAATTVNDVVKLAGTSKKTLFVHFGSKEECFLATYDLAVREAAARVSTAYRARPDEERDWAAGLCRAFDAFVAELVEHPRTARIGLVDILAAEAGATERIERTEAIFAWMFNRSFAQAPDGTSMPPALLRSLLGGIWFVARVHLMEGNPEEIAGSGELFRDWILSYHSPLAREVPLTVPVPSLRGEAAPEWRRRNGRNPEPLVTRLEWICAEALAYAVRASEGAPTWAASTCRAVTAIYRCIATDEEFASAAFGEALAAGPEVAEYRIALLRGFATAFARRVPPDQRPDPLIAEATIGAIWSIAHRCALNRTLNQLPALAGQASFLALAPVVGAEQALETIREELLGGGSGQPAIAI
ncbi:MAG TPA: TetR/AcrR family transcriptional regulator [Solirubrobacterales bacterium]